MRLCPTRETLRPRRATVIHRLASLIEHRQPFSRDDKALINIPLTRPRTSKQQKSVYDWKAVLTLSTDRTFEWHQSWRSLIPSKQASNNLCCSRCTSTSLCPMPTKVLIHRWPQFESAPLSTCHNDVFKIRNRLRPPVSRRQVATSQSCCPIWYIRGHRQHRQLENAETTGHFREISH